MDTIENIQNAILNEFEGAVIVPWNNGGIQVTVQDSKDCGAILALIGQIMFDYDCDDVQVTTNQARYEVYIDVADREDDEEEDEWEEEEDCPRLKPGDVICYRMGVYRVVPGGISEKGAWVKGQAGEMQQVDWEDICKYNPEIVNPYQV